VTGKRDSMRNGSNIQFQTREQDRVKKEFYEIKGSDRTYVSKPVKDACMSSNLKTLHQIFFYSLQERSSMKSSEIVDKERIIELEREEDEIKP
jgi:hypothetical protein